jgi:hypothetical protein
MASDTLPFEKLLAAVENLTWAKRMYLHGKLTSLIDTAPGENFLLIPKVKGSFIAQRQAEAPDNSEQHSLERILHSLIALDQQQLRSLMDVVHKRLLAEPIPSKYANDKTGNGQEVKPGAGSIMIGHSDIFPKEILRQQPAREIPPAQKEAHQLFSQARRTSDPETRNQLLDQAIRLAEQANLPSFEYKLLRSESLAADPSEILDFYREAATYYKQTGDLFRQVNSLRNMAFVALRSGNKEQALTFLDEEDAILSRLTAEDIAEITAHSHIASIGDVETRIQALRVTLSRDRRSFTTGQWTGDLPFWHQTRTYGCRESGL